jgi:hypothetical protein
MGVVRREGDWRLEKRGEGEYEITYQNDTQLKVITPDHRPSDFGGSLMEPFPIQEVDSYSEVEGLFEERAHGPAPGGFTGIDSPTSGSPATSSTGGFDEAGENVDLDEIPPGLLAIVLAVVGGFVLYSLDTPTGSPVFLLAVGFVVGGIAIFAWAGVLYREEGIKEALLFLFSIEGGSQSNGSNEVEKTPPLSQRKRDELCMDRADMTCEWCGDETDAPEVHHIKPRAEGGPNNPENLIVLCPNCHREKPDVISQSKFRMKVRRQMDDWEGFLENNDTSVSGLIPSCSDL